MKELRIPFWTGVCNVEGKQILGLGNDLYQIGVAIADGIDSNAAKVTFNEADAARKSQYNIDGIIALFPSLCDGIFLNDGEITGVDTPSLIHKHWQMANYSSSLLRHCLTTYLKPYIKDSLKNDETYEDKLVIHLRGGDALNEWAQNEWRPSPVDYEFYQEVIERSKKTKILIVTTPPQNGIMHPLVNQIRDDHDADIQHGTILEDFSVLINCTNLVLDFSTFGYTAALMNANLKSVFIPKFVDKKGISLLNDIKGDIGFTMPEIDNCSVYVYDYPNFIVKNGSHRPNNCVIPDKSQAGKKLYWQNQGATSDIGQAVRGWRIVACQTSSGFAWDVHSLAFMHGSVVETGLEHSSGFACQEQPSHYGPQNAFSEGGGHWGGRANAQGRYMLGLKSTSGVPVDRVIVEQGKLHWAPSIEIEVLGDDGCWCVIGAVEDLGPGFNEILLVDVRRRSEHSSPVPGSEPFGAPNQGEVSNSQITVIQGGLSGSGFGSYFFLEIVGMIEDFLKSDNRNFVVIPKTDSQSSYFPRPGTSWVNLWSTFFEPINPHLLALPGQQ